jgi:hypothetical protein
MAIAGLERTEAKLREYAERRGLVVRPELIWPGQPLPHEQQGPVRHACWSVAGKLPGGVAGRLRHQAVYGETFGMQIADQHTVMICRIPESVGYLPMLSVRAEGLEPALFYWAGDTRPREDVGGFESVELDRRYILEVAKGQDHAWLRQLFPPSFVDWLASNTPVDFGFRLDGGVFSCECPQYRGQHRADGEVDEEHLDLLAEAGGRAASRIRDEVLEEADVSWGGTDPDSAAAHQARTTGRKHGRLLGLVLKLAGADGPDESVVEFGRKHGMEAIEPAEFHANHIRLPLPGTASDVLTGPLPGARRDGELAWLEFSSIVDMQRNYNAVVIEGARELPSLWVDADDVTVPGFGAELGGTGLQAAAEAGYGVSVAGRTVCVYMSSPQGSASWASGAELERFCGRAAAIADAIA